MISINYTPTVLVAQRNLSSANNALNKALTRMSTGYRINSAADDAAGYYITSGINSQLRGLKQTQTNVNNSMSYLNIAESSLSNMANIFNRLRDLAVQGASGTLNAESRKTSQLEADALIEQLINIQNNANFNNLNVFGNNYSNATASNIQKAPKIEQIKSNNIPAGYTAIYTAEDLQNINNNLSGKYILMNDIDLKGIDWETIGAWGGNSFTGTFDGNGYTIKNLTIDDTTREGLGLFGVAAYGAIIKNLGMENTEIKAKGKVGSLAGVIMGEVVIENSYSISGTISCSESGAGGLIGIYSGNCITVENCYTDIDVTAGAMNAGGIIGYTENYAGSHPRALTISNCYALGDINATTNAGGIAGVASSIGGAIIKNCYSTGDITASSWTAGGIVANCFVDIENCYSTGNITAEYEAGGIAGYLSTHQRSCIVKNSYSTGKVTGIGLAGATIGCLENNSKTAVVENCTWDINKTVQTECIGSIGGTANVTNCHGVTTSELKKKETYNTLGWDLSAWSFANGNPMLKGLADYAGTLSNNLRIQLGTASNPDINSLSIDLGFNIKGFNIDITTEDSSKAAITQIDEMLKTVNSKLAHIGATQNRLESVIERQNIEVENLTSTQSTIKDADIAEETSNYIKNQILLQTTSTLITQAQSLNSGIVMSLISALRY